MRGKPIYYLRRLGNLFTIRVAACIVERRWRVAKLISRKKIWRGENYEQERETFLDLLPKHLLIKDFPFDAMWYSSFGNENSDVGHIKCISGPRTTGPSSLT